MVPSHFLYMPVVMGLVCSCQFTNYNGNPSLVNVPSLLGKCMLNAVKINQNQIKFPLLHDRFERVGKPQITKPQLRPITRRGVL